MFAACLMTTQLLGQCTADFDFGDASLGVSPNPELGEQFEPGVVGQSYEDILHILLPQLVLEIDPTLPFFPTTPLDSASLSSVVLVDLNDTLSTTTLEAVGLQVICNNNGDSGNPCSFLGGNQYCASLTGTPSVQGSYRVDIYVTGWVTVFGFPFSQEQVFGSFILDLGELGCTDDEATNYNPNAVVVFDAAEGFCYQVLDAAFQVLQQGAPLIAVGGNRYYQSGGSLHLDAGPFVKALEYAADVEAQIIGKPAATFFISVAQSMGCDPANTLMVGDDIDGDVLGAQAACLQAALVKTGKYRSGDEQRVDQQATMVLDTIADLPARL